jgi:hypothetical protein
MIALALLDTNWAGVIRPDPDSAQAGEVEPEHILAPADGPRRTVTFRLRVYTATELARLLVDVGFAEIECFGDLDGAALAREGRLVVRARKPRSHDGPSPPTATASG